MLRMWRRMETPRSICRVPRILSIRRQMQRNNRVSKTLKIFSLKIIFFNCNLVLEKRKWKNVYSSSSQSSQSHSSSQSSSSSSLTNWFIIIFKNQQRVMLLTYKCCPKQEILRNKSHACKMSA